MPISADWDRPFSEAAEAKTTPLTHTLTEQSDRAVIDATVSIGGHTKLVARLILTPVTSGKKLGYKIKLLKFPGDAVDRTSATVPADAAATTNGAEINVPEEIDLDAFFTTAGSGRTDPTPSPSPSPAPSP